MRLSVVGMASLLALTGCNVLVSLDDLSAGAGGAGTTSTGSSPTTTTTTGSSGEGGSGAAGGGGGGDASTSPWDACVTQKDPWIRLRMSGAITEPNLGTSADVAPEGTYFAPHEQDASLIFSDPDGAASFAEEEDPPTESGRLELPDPGRFGPYDAFTIELWFETPDVFDEGPLVSRIGPDGGFRLSLLPREVSDGLDLIELYTANPSFPNGDTVRQVIQAIDLSEPQAVHHLVAIYRRAPGTTILQNGNADDMVLWIDGVMSGNLACCGVAPLPDLTGADLPLVIGSGYSGVIDEVVIYDRELTAAEIQSHYALGDGPDTTEGLCR